MKEYFDKEFELLNSKIDNYNNLNFFKKIFSNIEIDFDKEVQRIFNANILEKVRSTEDVGIFMSNWIQCKQSLEYDHSLKLLNSLLMSEHTTVELSKIITSFIETTNEKKIIDEELLEVLINAKK